MSSPRPAPDYRPWEPAQFGESPPRTHGHGIHLPTATEVEEIHRAAHQEGYAEGRKEGAHAAHAEAERLQAVIKAVGREWQACEERTGEQIVALSLAIARAVVRDALTVQPDLIVTVVREAVARLPAFAQPARVVLHPEDAALVREHLGSIAGDPVWELHEDASIARGDCRVTQGCTEIDATLAQRWQQVTAALGNASPWLPLSEAHRR